jgi:hypothetical protein
LCQYVASAFEVRVFGECEVSPDLGDLGDENSDPWDPGYSINRNKLDVHARVF